MNIDSKFFKLFSTCKLVKGFKRSAIYDLQRNYYKLIPNDLYNILKTYKHDTIDSVKLRFEKHNHKIIDDYFKMLVENEFIFFCDEDELILFPELEEYWDYPGIISNAIIELPMDINTLLISIISLEDLGCRHIQFRSFETLDYDYINVIFDKIYDKDIDYVEIISKWTLNTDTIETIVEKHKRLKLWILHSAPETKKINLKQNTTNIVWVSDKMKTHNDFVINSKNYFNVNITLFSESKLYNNYYNRKVCIDKYGKIKNCLSLKESYGIVTDNMSIKKAVMDNSFQTLWHVKKDDIEVCKDCEYRYMCVDNTPLSNVNGKWKKEKECFYNPYKSI